jgi:hypothetical protein
VCRRLSEIGSQCPQIGFKDVDVPSCVRELEASADSAFMKVAGRCFTQETRCDAIVSCLASIGESTELRSCEDVASAGLKVGLPRAAWERRNGASVTTFRNARSSKAAPIEMCGITEANLWLTTLRCGDGSQPLRDRAAAEGTRAGNVGGGGRCGSIVDRYVVPCPEASYEIFIDAYICALPDP